ncbi:MAG: DUF1611 domain-containing protein [Burkholderiaceae bacterium]
MSSDRINPSSHGSLLHSHLNRAVDSAATPNRRPSSARGPTAVVYAEGLFGELDGKTANGLARSSEKYKILSVIDSTRAGVDSGIFLEGKPNGIPVVASLDEAVNGASQVPEYFIFGIAPSSGLLSHAQRSIIMTAIARGMNVISGLHEFLSEDPAFAAASAAAGVSITDMRKPPDSKDLHAFTGEIAGVGCPRIAILGTDCAIGKRTTAVLMTRALNDAGIHAVMVATGQTGLIQGARYGTAMDAIASQFCAGELEAAVVRAYKEERPDVIIVEGQGALSHPAFSTSAFILRGSQPQGVVVQHAPGRPHRCDFPDMLMPSLVREINLIELFADTRVIGVTINHENMSETEVAAAILKYKRDLGLPVTDPLARPNRELVQMVESAFPKLRRVDHSLA